MLAQRRGAQGNTHFMLGKRAGKKRDDESWDSKSSEWNVLAELPRPWRRIMVCVWERVGCCIDEDEVWAMVESEI
jgi:hypothetical protein